MDTPKNSPTKLEQLFSCEEEEENAIHMEVKPSSGKEEADETIVEDPVDEVDLKEASGDYFDLRDFIKARTPEARCEYVKNLDRKRVLLIREHLISVCAYNEDIDIVNEAFEGICQITRTIHGNFEHSN